MKLNYIQRPRWSILIHLVIFVSDFGSKPYFFFFFFNSRQTKTNLKTRDKSNSDETAVPASQDSTQAGAQQEKRVTSANRAEETEVTRARRRRDGEWSIQIWNYVKRMKTQIGGMGHRLASC